MRTRTVVLIFGGAAAAGAAVVAATVATLLAVDADTRIDRTYLALSEAFFAMPPSDRPPVDRRPQLVLVPD